LYGGSFRCSNDPNDGPRAMLRRQLNAGRISREGAQFVSYLGFEYVDAHNSS
jgi:hypothetical protein